MEIWDGFIKESKFRAIVRSNSVENKLTILSTIEQDPVRPQELSRQGQKLEAAIRAGAQAVLNFKDALNEWDRLVGDGDCGTTVRFSTILNALELYEP